MWPVVRAQQFIFGQKRAGFYNLAREVLKKNISQIILDDC